jgi:hypothetical protein
MWSRLSLAALSLLVSLPVASAGAQRAAPPRPVPPLNILAAAWSGGADGAICRDDAGMEEVPPAFRPQTCEWPRVTRGREFSQVTGMRGPLGDDLHALTWERAVADSMGAARLADSLSTALRAIGLTEYACPDAGRRWQRSGFTVQYTRGVVHRDGLLRVAVFATTLPNAIPEFACPVAPKLPAAPPPTQKRRAAT